MKHSYSFKRVFALVLPFQNKQYWYSHNSLCSRLIYHFTLLVTFVFFAGMFASAQAPELVFRNPVLKSGNAKKQGAIYRFSDVTTGVDAEVLLKKFSRQDIYIEDIDVASMGWDKAFQPQFGLSGNVAPNQNWYIDFEVSFYKAGTSIKQKMSQFDLTSLDVDGDGVSIAEYVVMENPNVVNFSTVSFLLNGGAGTQIFTCHEDDIESALETCSKCNGSGLINSGSGNSNECDKCEGSGKLYSQCHHAWSPSTLIQGPVLNFVNIDTAATQVMATYTYLNRDKVKFRIGAKSGSQTSSAGVRLNSMWYRSFSLAPQGSILPVKLIDFSAKYANGKVNLNWTSAQEKQFSHFVIQRSADGSEYKDVSVVFSEGEGEEKKDYAYTDAGLSKMGGLVYYRLKMVDADQNNSYSAVRIIRITEEKAGLTVTAYPNPVINDLKITVPAAWQNRQVRIEIYNSSNGQKVKELISKNANQTEVIPVQQLARGIYLLKASCGTETVQQKIMKN